jgi:hypothetical protein
MIKALIFGSLFFLLVFGCVGSKPQTPTSSLGISDSDIAPTAPPAEPTLSSDQLVINDSDFSLSENDTTVFPEDDLVLASEDVLIESQ